MTIQEAQNYITKKRNTIEENKRKNFEEDRKSLCAISDPDTFYNEIKRIADYVDWMERKLDTLDTQEGVIKVLDTVTDTDGTKTYHRL